MKKFMVAYCMPVAGLDEWMKIPQEQREKEEAALKVEWDAWLAKNGAMIKETGGLGKTKRVTTSGIADAKNDLMMYSIAEAESQEDVAKAYEGHPHLKIPGSWIDIMPMNQLPGMGS